MLTTSGSDAVRFSFGQPASYALAPDFAYHCSLVRREQFALDAADRTAANVLRRLRALDDSLAFKSYNLDASFHLFEL